MSNIKKIWIGVAVVAVIVLAVILTSTNTPDTIKLGILSPLSGEYAVAGENYEKGIELARDLYVKNHPDRKIELVVEDDGFDMKKGVSAYKKLTSIDHVDSIMMLSTPVIDAIYQDVIKTDMPVMQLGIQTKGVAKDNIFQSSPSPEAPIEGLADYVTTHYDFKKLAIVYDNTPGGLSFYNAFVGKYTRPHENFIVNSRDNLSDYATKISRGGFDAVVFLTSPENGAIMVRRMLSLSKTHPLFIFDAQLQTGFDDYKRILGGGNVLDGSISMWLKGGDATNFTSEFKKKYNAEPGFLADFGYDTFNILMNAYDADRATWLKNIQNTNSAGASGKISFDENGIRLQDIVINTVKDGKIVPVEGR